MDRLQRLLHQENNYYTTFKALAELDPEKIDNKVIILSNIKPANSKDHERQWNKPMPNVNEVAIIDISPDSKNSMPSDIIVHLRDGGPPKRIPETNRAFEPLHYTLLFPYGDDGWTYDLHLTNEDGTKKTGVKSKISPSQFHKHRMMDRDGPEHPEFNTVLRSGRLSQEYFCGMFFLGEKIRLDWIRNNQKHIKAEKYSGLLDALNSAEGSDDVGVRIVLPPSHVGSPRWYNERYQGN